MKYRTRDSAALARAIDGHYEFHTHGALYGMANVRTYTVFSYAAAIAWREDGQWYVDKTKYSVTTSRHQNTVRRALTSLGIEPTETGRR